MAKRKYVPRRTRYLILCREPDAPRSAMSTIYDSYKRKATAEKALKEDISLRLKRRRGVSCVVVTQVLLTTRDDRAYASTVRRIKRKRSR